MDARVAGSRPFFALIPFVLGWGWSVAPAIGADSPDLPRYRLQVGQELEYRGADRFEYQHGSLNDRFRDRAWVTRQNPDGSWRIVLCFQDKESQQREPKVATLRSTAMTALARVREAVEEAKAADEQDLEDLQMAYVDLFPDGRAVGNESITGSFHPVDVGRIFPLLPADAEQAPRGWHRDGASVLQPGTDYRLAEPTPTGRVIIADHHNLYDKIDLVSAGSRYEFDRSKGLVTRVDTTNTQGYGFVGQGAGKLELARTTDHGDERAASMDRES